jgi:hypothetical protein
MDDVRRVPNGHAAPMKLRAIAAWVLSASLLGCGSPTPPGGSGAAPSGTAPSGTTQSGAPGSPGTAGPDSRLVTGVESLADQLILASLAEAAEFENQLVDDFAVAVNLPTDLGPDTWAWVNQLIHEELAKAGEKIVLSGPAALTASLDAGPPLTAADGGGAVGLGMALGLALVGLGDSSGPPLNGNISLDSTGETVENGERSVGVVTMELSTSTAGSTFEADVEIGVDVTVTDAATGVLKRTGSFQSGGKIKLGFCPDADGKIKGSVRMSLSGGTSDAGSGTLVIEAEVTGTVGEDAYLQTIDMVGQSTMTTTVNGSTRRLDSTGTLSTTVDRSGQLDVDATRGGFVTVGERGSLTQADADEASNQITFAAGIAVWLVGDRAQGMWRSGACVEIRATEQSRAVRKNQLVQFEARPWHKIEGRELAKKIVPEFTGKASLDPVDIAVQSPVLLSFKAGPRERDKGTIMLTSTSNRGIGKLTIEFTVYGGWVIDGERGGGRIHGEKCGDPVGEWVAEGTYSQGGFEGIQTWTFTIGPDGRTGTMLYSSSSEGTFLGVKVYSVGVAYGTVTLTIQDDGTAHMDIIEESRGYFTTTSKGGHGTNIPLPPQVYPGGLDWSPGGNC